MVGMNNQAECETRSLNTIYPRKKITFCPVCGADAFTPNMQTYEHIASEYPGSYTCGVCGFEFFLNAAASTMALIFKDDDTILMMRRRRDPMKGTLDLPGGFISPGERAEDGMRREVLEETNLVVVSYEPYRHTYCNEYLYEGVLYHTLDLVYLCRVDDWSPLSSNDPDEGDPVLIPIDELQLKQVGLASVRWFLSDYIVHHRRKE